jgi:hypothetical protein
MNKWYNYGKWRHPEKRKELMKNMNKEQAKRRVNQSIVLSSSRSNHDVQN